MSFDEERFASVVVDVAVVRASGRARATHRLVEDPERVRLHRAPRATGAAASEAASETGDDGKEKVSVEEAIRGVSQKKKRRARRRARVGETKETLVTRVRCGADET